MRFAILILLLVACEAKQTNPLQDVREPVVVAFEPPTGQVAVARALDFSQEEKPEPDCSGLLEQRAVAELGQRSIKHNGRFAAGDMAGGSFIPMLYFNTLQQAKDCAEGLEVREWRKDHWVPR